MQRLILLGEEELAFLRERIQAKFLATHPQVREVKFNTVLANYEELRRAMEEELPEREWKAALSVKRLRKLFYYSNRELCPPGQAEQFRFGVDFLDACYRYLTDGVLNRDAYWQSQIKLVTPQSPFGSSIQSNGSAWKFILSALLLVSIVASQREYPRKDQIVDFVEEFDFENADQLLDRGWRLVDPYPDYWRKQEKPGHLTLYTLRGDYWCTPPDSPVIQNFLLRKIDCDSCDITIKLEQFNPTQNYQQAGFFLLDAQKRRDNNLRMTYAFTTLEPGTEKWPDVQFVQIIQREHGLAKEYYWFVRSPTIDTSAVSPYYLRMEIRGRKVKFLGKQSLIEDSSFKAGGAVEVELNFKPAYVGVAAFRGIRDWDGGPLNSAETIPAFFDYVKIRTYY